MTGGFNGIQQISGKFERIAERLMNYFDQTGFQFKGRDDGIGVASNNHRIHLFPISYLADFLQNSLLLAMPVNVIQVLAQVPVGGVEEFHRLQFI